jgi:hypothetical protein
MQPCSEEYFDELDYLVLPPPLPKFGENLFRFYILRRQGVAFEVI